MLPLGLYTYNHRFFLSVYLLWQHHATKSQLTPQDDSVADSQGLRHGQLHNGELATANHPQGTWVPEPRVITAVVVQGDWVRDVVVQRGSVTFSDDVILGNMTVIVEKGQMARVWAERRIVVQ